MMWKILTVAAAVGILFWAMPAPSQAEMVTVADAELAMISGKDHVESSKAYHVSAEYEGTSTLAHTITGDGNIQVGLYQWMDDHETDASNHKGANDQSGDSSTVQASVTALVNAISWGSYAGANLTAADLSGDQISESWATLRVGGF